jgi:hypothetical protein
MKFRPPGCGRCWLIPRPNTPTAQCLLPIAFCRESFQTNPVALASLPMKKGFGVESDLPPTGALLQSRASCRAPTAKGMLYRHCNIKYQWPEAKPESGRSYE